MLRRPKTVITLPKREDHRRFLKFSPQEQEAYDVIKKKTIQCLEDALGSSRPLDGYRNALEKINALRVICERGCLSSGSFLKQAPTKATTSDRYLATSISDGALTPSAISDDCEDGYNWNHTKFDDVFTEPDETLFLSEELSYFEDPHCTPGLKDLKETPGQWPTKIQALLQDVQNRANRTKR